MRSHCYYQNHTTTTAQMEVVQDSYDFDITMEVVEDSYDSVASEVVQQTAVMVHAEEDEVQSKQTEKDEVKGVHIEKFPEYEYENDSYEEKEYKKVVMSMLKIYLDRFY